MLKNGFTVPYPCFCELCKNIDTVECIDCTWSNFDMKPTHAKWTLDSVCSGDKDKENYLKMDLKPIDNLPPISKADQNIKTPPFTETITHDMFVTVGNMRDEAFIKVIREYAEKEGINEATILDETGLKEVITLGLEEFKKRHGYQELAYQIIQ